MRDFSTDVEPGFWEALRAKALLVAILLTLSRGSRGGGSIPALAKAS